MSRSTGGSAPMIQSRIGRPCTAKSGFGVVSVNGRRRVPFPAARTMASMGLAYGPGVHQATASPPRRFPSFLSRQATRLPHAFADALGQRIAQFLAGRFGVHEE